MAIFLLPRQFQVGVIENLSTKHLKTAVWSFPLYLLLFNLFVIYIAWAGRLELGNAVNSDYYSLLLPLNRGNQFLAMLVFLGGFSASISMVVVSSLALSAMVSNNLIIPYGYIKRFAAGDPKGNARLIKVIRRVAIFLLILLSYFFFTSFELGMPLTSIGLMAFVLVAQLAPSFFLGILWNRASAKGAIWGIVLGFTTVFYTLILPIAWNTYYPNSTFLTEGPLGIGWLHPNRLLGIDYLTTINHAYIWSLFVNTATLVLVSLFIKAGYRERNYAEMIVNEASYGDLEDQAFVWRGEAYVDDIKGVLIKFLGEKKTERALDIFYRKYNVSSDQQEADSRLVLFAEKLLAGRIGSASARILIANVIKEQPVALTDVLDILEESRQTLASNRQLADKSRQLHNLTDKLKTANETLIAQDKQKDEFLDTVAHELKTPITSIKAAAEILNEDDELEAAIRQQFIGNIVNDAERLSILIHNILDLEKLASGQINLNIAEHRVSETLSKTIRGLEQQANHRTVSLTMKATDSIGHYDEDRMIQVLTNVTMNALKFAPAETGEVCLAVEETTEAILVAIMDNGKGVPAEDAPYIFDRFYQSKDQNRRKPQGSGLGLSICRKIMERHQGTIILDQNYTNGARFIITIPKDAHE